MLQGQGKWRRSANWLESNREMDATCGQKRRRSWLTIYRKGNVMSGMNASNSSSATASSELPSEIWRWDATDITAHIRLRTITSSDAEQSCLDRIAEVNPHLNAIVHMVADNALREAKEADAAFTIGGVLRELGASGATILLVEQNMHFYLRIAEEALAIDRRKSSASPGYGGPCRE
jgi:hypothetical protein